MGNTGNKYDVTRLYRIKPMVYVHECAWLFSQYFVDFVWDLTDLVF